MFKNQQTTFPAVLKPFLVVALVLGHVAAGNAKNWNIGSGAWNAPTNWSPVDVPTAGEAVNLVFADGFTRTVTLDTNTPALGLLTIDLTGGVSRDSRVPCPRPAWACSLRSELLEVRKCQYVATSQHQR